MFNPNNNLRLCIFSISADGGSTWTEQFMTYNEVANEFAMGHIVKHKVMQRCEGCGALFYAEYCSDGTYEYMNDVCDCESEFHPYYSNEPSLSEFMFVFKN